MLKGIKELLIDEWSVGVYHRELALSTAVNGESGQYKSRFSPSNWPASGPFWLFGWVFRGLSPRKTHPNNSKRAVGATFKSP